MISIDQFKAVEIRIGEILSAEKVAGADKLLRLMVDFGPRPATPVAATVTPAADGSAAPTSAVVPEREVRQIVSGIAPYFPEPSALVGVKCAFATNLEPRVIRGLESNGMILATGGDGTPFTLLRAVPDAAPGGVIR